MVCEVVCHFHPGTSFAEPGAKEKIPIGQSGRHSLKLYRLGLSSHSFIESEPRIS